jgi:S-adenosylmethionine decarboxylase
VVKVEHRLGRQLLAELTYCDQDAMNDADLLEALLRRAAAESGATLLSLHVHRFEPIGLSAVAILAESHLAVHTWPELGYAAVDAFTCGDHVRPEIAVKVIEEGLKAGYATQMELNRRLHKASPKF